MVRGIRIVSVPFACGVPVSLPVGNFGVTGKLAFKCVGFGVIYELSVFLQYDARFVYDMQADSVAVYP